jgi:AbrB family looped-hinge helix DNA binding protein
MTIHSVKIDGSGRMVLPAAVRRALGIEGPDELVVEVEAGQVRLASRRAALAAALDEVRKYLPADADLADELIADRRAESRRE